MLFTGADAGFYVGGGAKFSKGSGDHLRSPAGPGQSPGQEPRGFEHLNSVSVNDFEAFCEVYQNMHLPRSIVPASQVRATFYGREKIKSKGLNIVG